MSDRSEKLLTVMHNVSMEPHIEIREEACAQCKNRACLYFCPAGCFEEEDGVMKFHYEGCLECGTCRVMCPKGIAKWDYPQGGYGVAVRLG